MGKNTDFIEEELYLDSEFEENATANQDDFDSFISKKLEELETMKTALNKILDALNKNNSNLFGSTK